MMEQLPENKPAPIRLYKTSEIAKQLINSIIGYNYLKSELQSLKKDQKLFLYIF
ncbi:MAG: hypothetical protein GX640_21520 [Fibrobacter sp.]|nr:hypothetical protein [Fibrobacter sp.]